MEKFDEILAVLADDDDEKLRKLGFGSRNPRMAPEEIEALVEERQAAKKRRDFKRSDEIRKQLADSGIILEDAKTAVSAGNTNKCACPQKHELSLHSQPSHERPNLYGVD